MENRKTAEEIANAIINNLDDYARDVDQYEFGLPIIQDHETENMHTIVLKQLNAFAEQEKEVWSCEVLEWVMKNGYYLGWVGIWYDSCGREVCTSTAQLYTKFKLERDGK